MGNHIFICYSRKDWEFVSALATRLRQRGVPVWLDKWDMFPGENYHKAIDTAIANCAKLLLVLSPDAVASDEVEGEWMRTRDKRKPIIPVLACTCEIPRLLRSLHWTDLTQGLDDPATLDLLTRALGGSVAATEAKPPSSPLPYEVTVAAYRKCVEAGKCSVEGLTKYDSCNWGKVDRAQHPINCVDWTQADTYCKAQGKRLPTEAEWEKAARGDKDQRIYPWGNAWDTAKANVGSDGTKPVGAYPVGKSPYGAYDMSGNVWEWVADSYDANYYQNGPAKNPKGPANGSSRSLRGGSWVNRPANARASYRVRVGLGNRNDVIGARCAQ